jgi:hypothetical protein
MLAKSLIAAVAVSASLAAIPAGQAEAKTNINVDVNLGYGYGYGGYGWYPGYNPYPAYNPYWGVSCQVGRKIVKNHGFYNVNAFDCSKPVYQYTAWKFGKPYKVRVNLAGAIIKVSKI